MFSSHKFKCTLDQAKCRYFRSVSAIIGRISRSASEELVLQLIASECLPILLFAAEVCGLSNRDTNSLDFVVNRFLLNCLIRIILLLYTIVQFISISNFLVPY
jgi:hypothetical protein